MPNDERNLAVFIDFENVALGVQEAKYDRFEVERVLERLVEKGKIVVKKAYCDWQRFREYKDGFHGAAIEMIEIPKKRIGGKNNADIKLVVDAMDLCYSKEHVDTFVIVSGDSDFSPLVSKLRENGKYVIGCGVKNSTSPLLVSNCDEFIYYEDVVRRKVTSAPRLDDNMADKKAEALKLLVETFQALQREDKDAVWGSMIKQTIKRKRPQFDEGYHGYDSFHSLLEDAARYKLLTIEKDKRSGSYMVTGLGDRMRAATGGQ